ncbi:hypothetical protein F5B22DRAFT_596276 [Xylaria bambusicola]|uniref:uncharacterized protein n=1 Tax=Xylaria bambusicola TaxID=326684 RepID=UPI002007CC22|nr:uncharacterized protein F5B22DRAFT_596276 [Xylaria bambusicola]KAI0521241.1 hypothetical protein F5B22DRAFT_596276 [Xylaria bambusicola]
MVLFRDTGSEKPQPKRTYHPRSRNGCSNCKKRKVKCDETKPQCTRCLSAGYRCEGFTKSPNECARPEHTTAHPLAIVNGSTTALSHATPRAQTHGALVELKIALPRTSVAEARSYRFFMEVAAPSLAGVFDGDFWLCEIPRACFVDRAIWHAVVSLGAVYEAYLSSNKTNEASRDSHNSNEFILQQSNLAIKALVNTSLEIDKWRTLTASVLFTHICSLQSHHEQAFMHLSAGHKIIQAMLVDGRTMCLKSTFQHTPDPSTETGPGILGSSAKIPVSLATLQAIIANLESHRQAMNCGGLIHETSKNHNFNLWLSYREPPNDPGRLGMSCVASENIINANRAAESLFYGLILYSQKHSDKLAEVVGKGDISSLQALISGQEPYRRCYTRLRTFYQTCHTETETATHAEFTRNPLNKSILTLRLFLTTMRLLLLCNPDTPSQPITQHYLRLQFEDILSTGEKILQLGQISNTSSTIPTPSTTQPLYMVAHSGFPQSLRQRAVLLLRKYPRCDGLWDTSFSAALADLMMRQERASAMCKEVSGEGQVRSEDEDDGEVEVLDRVYNYKVVFQGVRTAVIESRTWRDFLAGASAKRNLLTW